MMMPFGIIITAAACQMLLIPELPPVIGTYHTNALYYKGGGFSNFAKTTNNRTAGAIEEPPLTPPLVRALLDDNCNAATY